MYELTINGNVYQFNFNMGFMREINKTASRKVSDDINSKKNIGLQLAVAGLIDGDVEDLEKVLITANKGQSPRITTDLLDAYIDDPDTNIDKVFDDVLDFLKTVNATKKTALAVLQMVEEAKAEQENN